MMLACKDAVRIWSSDEIHHAPLMRRLAVRMHLMLCRHCSRYVRDLTAVQAAAKEASTAGPTDPALERRILEAVRRP